MITSADMRKSFSGKPDDWRQYRISLLVAVAVIAVLVLVLGLITPGWVPMGIAVGLIFLAFAALDSAVHIRKRSKPSTS